MIELLDVEKSALQTEVTIGISPSLSFLNHNNCGLVWRTVEVRVIFRVQSREANNKALNTHRDPIPSKSQ